MRGSRLEAFAAFFQHLAEGNPIAWSVVGGFVLLAIFFGLAWLKVRRDLRLEDEARDRRRGIKPKK